MSTNSIKPIAVIANASVLDPIIGRNNPDYQAMVATLEKTHKVVEVVISSSISQTLNRVKRAAHPGQKIDLAVIHAHGNPFGMQITENKNYWWAGANDFDAVEKDGRIILWSCMTAAGGPFSIAKRIQRATGRAVFAANDNVGGCEILKDAEGKYVPRFSGHHGDVTRSFSSTPIHEKSTKTFDLELYKDRCEIFGPEAVSANDHYLAALQPEARDSEEECLLRAARQNHPRAFYELGRFYGARDDLTRAVENFIQAAKLGNEDAIYTLAELAIAKNLEKREEIAPWLGQMLYEKGSGGSHQAVAYLAYFVAKGWYAHPECGEERVKFSLEAAVKAGNPAAHYVAGLLHFDGDLLPLSPKQAAHYFEKIKNSRYPEALYNLGYLYERGSGVKRSAERACELYTRALNQCYNNPFLARTIERRRSLVAAEFLMKIGSGKKSQQVREQYDSWIKKEFLPTETLQKIAEYFTTIDPDKYIEYLEAVGDRGDDKVQCYLGEYYQAQKKMTKAEQWLQQAAKNGNAKAHWHRGQIFLKRDQLQKALWAFLDAVMCGLTSAMNDVEEVRKKIVVQQKSDSAQFFADR